MPNAKRALFLAFGILALAGANPPVQSHSTAFSNTLKSIEELRIVAAAPVQRVPSFSLFFHRDPPRERVRVAERVFPDVAVSLVQEISQVEVLERPVVLVIRERAHAPTDPHAVQR